MSVLGVDPGGQTGVVVFDPRSLTVLEYVQLDLRGSDPAWAHWLERVVPIVERVAAERFLITVRTATLTRQYDALDVLGALRYLCVMHRKPLDLQMAGDAKAAFPDGVLKDFGYFEQVTGPHARDALRHALLASRRHYRTV